MTMVNREVSGAVMVTLSEEDYQAMVDELEELRMSMAIIQSVVPSGNPIGSSLLDSSSVRSS